MKIGIVCYPSLGGSGILATELGHQLALLGHEIHFISYEIPFRLRFETKKIFFHRVEINRYDLFKYPDYALTLSVKIAAISKKYNLDVLHVHYAIPHATSAFLAKQLLGTSRPVVITTLHGTDITFVGIDPSYFEIVKFSIEKSDGVTAVSENLKETTMKYFDIQKPIEVIHNFFIPHGDLIGTQNMRESYIKEGEKLILHSSNFRALKRVGDVIKIFTKMKKKIECKLLLLGTGPEVDNIYQMVQDHHLDEDVCFLGINQEIDSYIASADLLLLPSEQESFGLVALEAMTYGVPVIGANVGGLPEVVENGITGYLCPVGDIDGMANHAIELLSDNIAYEKMSQQSIKRAREKFSVSHIINHYVQFYEYILNKKS